MHLPDDILVGNAVRVGIGDARLGDHKDAMRATLGSCVGVCLVYPDRRQFALAHVLLPTAPQEGVGGPPIASRYADTVVGHLLEMMEVEPVERRKLRAYVAGGASMFDGGGQRNHVGEDNRAALMSSLKDLRVRVAEEDFGGDEGRQLLAHGPKGLVASIHLENPEASRVWEFPATYRIAGDLAS